MSSSMDNWVENPMFVSPIVTCTAINTSTHKFNNDASIDVIPDYCKYWQLDSGNANSYICLKCVGAKTGYGVGGHLDCSQPVSGCLSSPIYNVPSYWMKLSSCNACTD